MPPQRRGDRMVPRATTASRTRLRGDSLAPPRKSSLCKIPLESNLRTRRRSAVAAAGRFLRNDPNPDHERSHTLKAQLRFAIALVALSVGLVGCGGGGGGGGGADVDPNSSEWDSMAYDEGSWG